MISTIPIQIIGILTSLAALHLTYLYYKRKSFTKTECFVWFGIWLSFIFVTVFPRIIQPVATYLGLQRAMDFIMIVAFIVLFALSFFNYASNKKQWAKLESLIRTIALNDIPKTSNKTDETL